MTSDQLIKYKEIKGKAKKTLDEGFLVIIVSKLIRANEHLRQQVNQLERGNSQLQRKLAEASYGG